MPTSSIKLVSPRICYTYITRTVLADSPRFRNTPAHCATDHSLGAIDAHRVAESYPNQSRTPTTTGSSPQSPSIIIKAFACDNV